MTRISDIRQQQVRAQNGLCFYCRQPMWDGDPDLFARRHGLRGSRLHWLQATAEHLLARKDGGPDTAANIVAACRFCNSRRHHGPKPLPPAEYARKVQRRLAAGRWHGLQLVGDKHGILPGCIQGSTAGGRRRTTCPPSSTAEFP